MRNGKGGVIYVSINYRLGLFGWLPGAKFENEGGLPNAGFYDQRLALEWVQTYIHLFGGDPDRVTVFGLSSGAGSIMHHITAYGGKTTNNFAQAVMQSPAWTIVAGMDQQEAVYSQFLNATGVSTLAEARALSTETLQLVNLNMIGNAPYGSEVFGTQRYFIWGRTSLTYLQVPLSTERLFPSTLDNSSRRVRMTRM